MAEETKVVSAFPHPPAYYKLFAKGGGDSSSQQKDGAASQPQDATVQQQQQEVEHAPAAGAQTTSQGSEQPSTVRSGVGAAEHGGALPLQPPPLPPAGGTYSMFGVAFKVDFELEYLLPREQVLFGSGGAWGGGSGGADVNLNFKLEMRRLLDSVMANYSQLLEVLLRCPSLHAQKVSALEQLFVNMHNLMNHFRPHEARECLIRRLRHQIQEQERELERLSGVVDQSSAAVTAAVGGLKSAAAEATGATGDMDTSL